MEPATIPLPESPSPSRIPLPPSPKVVALGLGPPPRPAPTNTSIPASRSASIKQRIRSRRPEGWVSTLPRSLSATGAAGSPLDDSAPRKGAPKNARVVSGLQLDGGRIVSGAIQYTLLPSPVSPTSSEGFGSFPTSPIGPSRELEYETPLLSSPGDFIQEDDTEDSSAESEEVDEDINWDQVHELTDDLVNPEWMGYVRQQLAALFPDFGTDNLPPALRDTPYSDSSGRVGARPLPLTLHAASAGNDMPRLVSDASTASADSLRTPPTASSMGQIVLHAQQTAARLAVDAVDQVRAEEGGTMRQELSAMREEMERLRSFVGDLAGGMARQQTEGGGQSLSENHTSRRGEGDGEAPGGYRANLELCAEIIRHIHHAMEGRALGSDHDEEIFSADNLENILARLRDGAP